MQSHFSRVSTIALLAILTQVPLAAAQTTDTSPPTTGQKETTIGERVGDIIKTLTGDPAAKADRDMSRVLEHLAKLDPKPIEALSVEEARKQPSIADAAKALLKADGQSDAPEPGVVTEDVTIDGAAGSLPARIYRPESKLAMSGSGMPVVLYFHGGGWVIADLDTYDATPRAMARQANAMVISVHYRQAPEYKFPAAHDDAFAAYQWLLANAEKLGGDPKRIAVMGESAGGNLAINVSMAAHAESAQPPLHQVLIYPVAGIDMNTPSYQENENAKPLNKAMVAWFLDKFLAKPEDKQSPKLDLVGAADLQGLPPTTIVTAEIDPLRSDGQMLAEKLDKTGNPVLARNYDGVAHEFFGTGTVVADAKAAQAFVAERLNQAFEPTPASAKK